MFTFTARWSWSHNSNGKRLTYVYAYIEISRARSLCLKRVLNSNTATSRHNSRPPVYRYVSGAPAHLVCVPMDRTHPFSAAEVRHYDGLKTVATVAHGQGYYVRMPNVSPSAFYTCAIFTKHTQQTRQLHLSFRIVYFLCSKVQHQAHGSNMISYPHQA